MSIKKIPLPPELKNRQGVRGKNKTPTIAEVVPYLPCKDCFFDIRHLVWGGRRAIAIRYYNSHYRPPCTQMGGGNIEPKILKIEPYEHEDSRINRRYAEKPIME